MSAISEIKDAIQKKIAGQGSQVDIGNGLPSVLNGMADLIQKSQELLSGGYLFSGFRTIESPDDLPEVAEDEKLFCIALLDEGEENSLLWKIYVAIEGVWEDTGLEFFAYRSGGEIKVNPNATDGYVTPKGLVEYAPQFFDISSLEEISFGDPAIPNVLGVSEEQFQEIIDCNFLVKDGKKYPYAGNNAALAEIITEQTGTYTFFGFWGIFSITKDPGIDPYVDGATGFLLMNDGTGYGLCEILL